MKIIVCGAGQVGGQIARHIAREEGANSVTVIDSNAAVIRRLTDLSDVNGVAGFAATGAAAGRSVVATFTSTIRSPAAPATGRRTIAGT